MIRPTANRALQPARRKRRRAPRVSGAGEPSELRQAHLALARALWERRSAREARVLAYLNVRAERHTEEKLVAYWSRFSYWAPNPNALLPTAFEKLESGEASQALARTLLGQWIDAVTRAPPPPGVDEREHHFWIAAIRRIVEGADPSLALRFKIGHRRPGKERDMRAAANAWWLIHRENAPTEQAFVMVARPLAVTPKHVRDLYYKHRANLTAYFSRR